MKKVLFATLIIFSAGCANEKQTGKFSVTGEIKNAPAQKIYLEQLYFSDKNPEILDTAEIKDGKFELSAIAVEEGLFRLRLEKNERGYLFINDQPKIMFNANIADSSMEGPVFNSSANDRFKKLMLTVSEKSRSMSAISGELNQLKTTNGNDSLQNIRAAELNGLQKQFTDFIIKYVDTSTDPVVTMFALGYTQGAEPGALKSIIPGLEKRFPKHQGIASIVLQYNQYVAKQNQSQPRQGATPANGDLAPDFTMNDVNGKPVSLSSFKGKYVLVDFWASWCGPCRGENPSVVAAYNKFKDKNFTILGVSLDENKDEWIKAIKADNLSWTQVSDLKGWSCAAVPLYGFDGIPYNVLVDPEGKIIASVLRGSDLENKLNEVLK